MFALDSKSLHRIGPTISRVVIADPNQAASRLLSDLVKGIGAREVAVEEDEARAFQAVQDLEPGLVFTEWTGPDLRGDDLARRIRKSNLICRRVPIIMITAEATATSIKGARDAGVHEFLRKPFTSADLFRRIENVTMKSRDWIEGITYIGPDRRRFNSGEYTGPRKRKADSDPTAPAAVKDQSLRILAAVLDQFDSDPAQAVRSAAQQAETLKALGMKGGQTDLAIAAADLQAVLQGGRVTKDILITPIQALLAMADAPLTQPAARSA